MQAVFGMKFEEWRVAIDGPLLRRRYETAAHRALSRVGAILRQEMRKSIPRRVVTQAMRSRLSAAAAAGNTRKVKRAWATIDKRQSTVSKPGEPPYAHVPDHPVASIRAIYFAVDAPEVLIGPLRANQATFAGGGRSSVPELLEFGGTQTIHEERFAYLNGKPGEWRRQDLRRGTKPWKRYRTRSAQYAARPFARRTLDRNMQTVRRILASAFGLAA